MENTNLELATELACYATGMDCAAQAAWLHMAFATSACHAEYTRAATHWALLGEQDRDALAAWLGISQPFPAERCPVPPAIGSDYKVALARAEHLLAE